MTKSFSELANHVWAVADLLRGDYKQSDYGKVILPFTLLRRLECVLEPTKDAVLAEYDKRKASGVVLDPEVRHFRAVFTPPADPRPNQIKHLEAARAIFV